VTNLDTFHQLTPDALHKMGGLKWSTHPEALPAWVAEMDFGCAPPIIDAMHRAVDSTNFGYLPPSLRQAMSDACAEWLGTKFGWTVPSDSVRPLADVLTAYELVINHFSDPDGAVIVPTPSYAPFLTIAAALGRRVIELPMQIVAGRYVIDPDGLEAAFIDGGALLVLCDPHNPTGTVYTAEEHLEVAEVVHRHGGRVFADAIHAPLVYPGQRHIPYASVSDVTAGHTVTALSAAKGWNLAGLKAAQVILSNAADLATWAKVGGHAEVGASTFGLVASTAAYSEGDPWLVEVMEYLDDTRHHVVKRFADELPQARVHVPEGTYFAWLDLSFAGLGDATVDVLRERAAVTLTDGIPAGDGYAGFVRFNFGTPRPIVDLMIDRIVAALV
jgi:cystathionine beta-lyase